MSNGINTSLQVAIISLAGMGLAYSVWWLSQGIGFSSTACAKRHQCPTCIIKHVCMCTCVMHVHTCMYMCACMCTCLYYVYVCGVCVCVYMYNTEVVIPRVNFITMVRLVTLKSDILKE